MHCLTASGAAVVVDITDMNSLEDARFWKEVVDRYSLRSLPAILLATKCDQEYISYVLLV